MSRPEKLLIVCANERPPDRKESCGTCHGSAAIGESFRKYLKGNGLNQRFRATVSGCLGPCADGPHAVVMPDNIWYSGFGEQDVEEIIQSHLVNGEPVTRLLATDQKEQP
jgi:(2Fe-2S) ferredoxin